MRTPLLLVVASFLLVALAACGGNSQKEGESQASAENPNAQTAQAQLDRNEELQQARGAANKLGIALKKELGDAMAEGGPVAALDVCSTRATAITAELREETGLELGRVSAQWRNPDNAPDETEAAVLGVFEADPAHGDTLLTLASGELLYMKPIRVGSPLCLRCHGPEDQLAPEIAGKLAELYPDDRATGFGEGDLRGAFTVLLPAEKP